MEEKELFGKMYRLTKHLKGAPLKEYEKKAIVEEFNQADGTAFVRAEKAIAKVLHGKPSFIHEKGEALESVGRLIDDVRKAAEKLDG
jgi:hypothetical protein